MASQRFAAEQGNDQPDLTDVVLEDRRDAGWSITLCAGDLRVVGALGIGRWATTGDVAISGGWSPAPDPSAPGTVRIDVVFLDTPHRLRFICRRDTGTFHCHWVTAPLQSPPLPKLFQPS
jgi:hypothetical protein